MNSIKSNKVKMLAAVIGGSAVVTMGALAMSIHQQPNGTDNLAMGKMTVAATTTESGKDDTVVATSMAEMEWSEVKSRQFKTVSAGVGACAILAMSALGVAFSDVSAAEEPTPAPPGPVTTSEITTGATVTDTAEMEGPETSVAVPPITTPPSTIGQEPPG